MEITLRQESAAEHRAVEELVREAFWNVYQPGCNEHHYLHLLRQSPAFRPELTFVCEADGQLAGQIACSASWIELAGGGRLDTVTFGPLAVLPRYQKQGLARALVCHALRAAQAAGQQAAVILGDPRHYGRYGFWCGEKWGIALENGQYLPGLQAVELSPDALTYAAGRFHEGGEQGLRLGGGRHQTGEGSRRGVEGAQGPAAHPVFDVPAPAHGTAAVGILGGKGIGFTDPAVQLVP